MNATKRRALGWLCCGLLLPVLAATIVVLGAIEGLMGRPANR
jgi:hypothetical protein